jgi:hypothetical protein
VLPVYIGDDRTDEDAFKVLRKRGQGVGILVSKHAKDTNASYSLQEPAEASAQCINSVFFQHFSRTARATLLVWLRSRVVFCYLSLVRLTHASCPGGHRRRRRRRCRGPAAPLNSAGVCFCPPLAHARHVADK